MSKIIGYIFVALIVIFAIFVIIVIGKMSRERAKAMNANLPDLNDLNKNKDEDKKEVVEHVDGFENSDALSVSSKTKVNREDYIKGDKKTSFEDDFGHVFDAEEKLHQKREPKPKEEVKIEVNQVNLPKLDDNKDNKKDGE